MVEASRALRSPCGSFKIRAVSADQAVVDPAVLFTELNYPGLVGGCPSAPVVLALPKQGFSYKDALLR